MTPEEESKLLNGPFPWRLPGVIVTRTGALCSVEPDSERRPFDGRKERRELSTKIQEEAERDAENLSRPELQATAQMTREELALKWDELKRAGKAVMKRREHFKEWIGSRLQEAQAGEHERQFTPPRSWPFPYRVPTWGEPRYTDAWHHEVRAESHRGGFGRRKEPDFRQLQLRTRRFNRLLYRYRTLRTRRRSVAYGSTERPKREHYNPSPSAEEILSAVARLDRENDGVAEVDIGEMDIGDVWGYLEEEMGLVNARANVRQDMRGREKAPGRYPEDTEELLEVAREVASERSQTFANPLNPDG